MERKPKENTQEELEKTRTITEAGLLKGKKRSEEENDRIARKYGSANLREDPAKYAVDTEGNRTLVISDEQHKRLHSEMQSILSEREEVKDQYEKIQAMLAKEGIKKGDRARFIFDSTYKNQNQFVTGLFNNVQIVSDDESSELVWDVDLDPKKTENHGFNFQEDKASYYEHEDIGRKGKVIEIKRM